LLDSVFVFGSILVGTLVLYGAADAAGAPIAGEVADWAATVGMVVFPVYGALFEGGSSGATPAKQMLNLHVVDRDGAPLGYAGAAWRNLAKGLLLGIHRAGVLTALPVFGSSHKAAWDWVAGTQVVVDKR
jgi:uncharacterized RDD family membrane protein YckC